ncbi:hypothetical protein [Mesorhizobium sp. B263B2A]|uniref:hypothetical protein n=1 Tax=Mesorhizobium sp. B263B2A TaxID=2876669 RepID=UPI001CD10DC3|nr:hypothetical protein [Mesorhizobium sp. B263B2A]MCA0029965.1 hypothetical protein [Mesorhizobium sp. B263B2A]
MIKYLNDASGNFLMSRLYRMKALLAASFATAATIPPMAVSAQAVQTSTQLEPVVVEGEAGGGAIGRVDGVVAKKTMTGSKTATTIKLGGPYLVYLLAKGVRHQG